MVENKYTFDPVAYLRDNPSVANPVVWQSDPYSHYLEAKSKGQNFKATFREPTASDPSQWTSFSYQPEQNNPDSTVTYYQDPNTGNIYSGNALDSKLIESGNATVDPYIQYMGISDPSKAQQIYDLQSTNPSEFYKQAATGIAKTLGHISHMNGLGTSFQAEQEIKNQLEGIKNIDPKAYYTGKLSLLSDLTGWDYGQNTPERSAARLQEIKSLIPEAKKAGLSAQEINNLTTNTINQSARANQERIANEKASGGSVAMDMLTKGLPFVGAFALGAYGLDAALAGGLAADAAAGAELAGPTYGELGYTGLAEGAAGPTYAELGYTGLNNQEAIALADAAAKQGISVQDAYKAYSRTKQIANLLNGGGSKTATNPQAIAAALQSTQTPLEQFGGLYRMNEKPFLQQKTASLSPDSYNVSGQDITSPTAPTNKLLADLLYKEV